MKIDRAESPPQPHRPKETFHKVLERQRPVPSAHPGPPRRAAKASGAQHAAAEAHVFSICLAEGQTRDVRGQQVLASARGEAEAASRTRVSARTEGLQSHEHLVKERIAELLAREPGPRVEAPGGPRSQTEREPKREPIFAAAAPSREPAGAPPPASAPAKVSSVMELVEKVEVFVRSNRPALSLTLGGELKGQVEIEKAGPGQVALRLRGTLRTDPRAPERIRQALAERGLTVTRLQVS